MKRVRLLLADDHTLVLAGIRKLLETDFDLVATVEDGHSVLQMARELKPDVILLDISMPLLNGIDACRQLVTILPGVRVIFLTMHADAAYIEEAFRAGGLGYLLKRSAVGELPRAIDAVMHGRKYVTPLLEQNETANLGRSISQRPTKGPTPRQRQVLQLIAEGKANKEIAALLNVSEKTVDFHKSRIKRTLKLGSTAELTQFAIKNRIIGV